MLETLRNAAKTWVAKLLLALLSASFVVWGISSSLTGSISGLFAKDLVTVGSAKISGPEYTAALERARKNLSNQTGQNVTLDEVHKMGVDKQVLDSMIDNASVDVEHQKLGLAVSNAAILQDLGANKAFQDAKGNFDPTLFKRILAQNNLNEANFVASQKQAILRGAITDAASGQFALPKTFDQALIQFRGETRDVKYFSVTASEADVQQPNDADIKTQYDKTPVAYTAPEYRSIALLKVDPADLASRIQTTPEELAAFYEQHKADYFVKETRTIIQLPFPSVEAAQKAKDRLASGEDITKIAGELNLKEADYTLADKVKADFLDKKIGEAAFALKEGEISAPVQGSLATAILKAVKVNAEKQPTLDEVKAKVSERLQLEKAKDEIQSVYNAVEDARGQKMSFEDIAKKANIPLIVAPAISAAGQDKTGKDVEIPSKPDVLKAVFASDVGVDNDALTVGDGYVWYDVREVVPSAVKPLEAVKEQVNQDIIAERIRNAAADKAKAIVVKAKSGTTIDALAAEAKGEVKVAQNIKRNEQSETFDGQALAALFAVPDQGFAYALQGDGKSARIMQIVKVTLPAVMAAASDDVKKLQDESKLGAQRDLQTGLIASLRKNANVVINEDLWKLNTGNTQAPSQ